MKPFWFPDLQTVVATGTLVLFGAVVIMLFFYPIPQSSSQLITTLAGMLAGAFVAVVSFYFGSSKGSADKDQTIQTLTQNGKDSSNGKV